MTPEWAELPLTRTLDWHGRTVAWDSFGSGPAVVFCHGTPWSAQLWAPFARALSREFTVYLWDMPGYGQSSKRAEHAVDLGVQGELFAELLRQWEIDRPQVVAHDFGGAVSLRALLVHGARFASLALVDVVAMRPWGSPFFRQVAEHAAVFSGMPPAVHRGAVKAYIGTASHHGLTAGQLATLTGPWLTEEGQAAFYRQIAQADERFTDEVQPRYPEIDLPVKIIWGTEDTWIPVDRASWLAEAIPGSTVDIIDGAAHLIQYDAPVELAVSLHRWLTAQR